VDVSVAELKKKNYNNFEIHFLVLLSATPQREIFPEMSEPQALIGALVSVPYKF
jgi:hypothetical protein